MKEGNNQKLKGNITVGMISSKLMLEGPVKKDTSSFIISARRFMYDLITRPASGISNDPFPNYSFYDVNAKFNHKFSPYNRIFLSFYAGDDNVFIRHKEDDFAGDDDFYKSSSRWGNIMGVARWNHIFSQNLFSNISLSVSRYRYNSLSEFTSKTEQNLEITTNNYYSGILDFRYKADFEYFISPLITIRFGHSLTKHIYSPGISSFKQKEENNTANLLLNQKEITAFENGLYLENSFTLSRRFSGNLGARYTSFILRDKTFNSLETRALISFQISKNLNLKASVSRMQQFVHLLTYSGMGIPTDLWVPSTQKIQPEKALQYSLGVSKSFSKNFEISLEYYNKKINNLIALREGVLFYSNSKDWQEKIVTEGEGTSSGFELLFQKQRGRFTGWFSYTMANSNRQFEQLNNAKSYPFKYDRRYDLSIVLLYSFSEKIDISGSWMYGSGYPVTLPFESFNTVTTTYSGLTYDNEIKVYSSKNNYRMRDFHKMDIGISIHKQKTRGIRTWRFSIYNLYNRKNPYYYFIRSENSNGVKVNKLYQQSLFPFIPSVSYTYRW